MKKIFTLIVSLVVILAGTAAGYGAEYTDVKSNHWASEAVKAMSDREIIEGYPDGSFRPEKTVTYGEFIKMALIAATGEDAGNAKTGHWALNYYNKALELRYFTVYDINQSQLRFEIPRSDMALIISSILGDMDIQNYDEIQKGIKDVTYSTEHEYDITKSYAVGILTGYTDHTFRPDQTLSRAESATVINRLADESKRLIPNTKADVTTKSAITTYPTSGLLDMSKLTPEKTIAVSVHFTDEYELYTDASEWDMKMYRGWDGVDCSFDHTMLGHIYLIKNGEIMDYCNTTPKYDSEGNYLHFQRSIADYDISRADYVICVPSKDHYRDTGILIKAVVNPFKQ